MKRFLTSLVMTKCKWKPQWDTIYSYYDGYKQTKIIIIITIVGENVEKLEPYTD